MAQSSEVRDGRKGGAHHLGYLDVYVHVYGPPLPFAHKPLSVASVCTCSVTILVQEDRPPGEMLDAVVTLCQCALSQETPVIPDEFRDTLRTLHGSSELCHSVSHTHAHTLTYTHTHTHTRTHACTHACTRTHTQISCSVYLWRP